MRLDIRVLGIEELLRAIDGELLDLIDELATAVVPLSGKTFGVFVGERRAHRFEDGFGDEVFARDKLESFPLAIDFATNDVSDVRIEVAYCRQLKSCVLFNFLHSPCLRSPR